MVPLEDPNRPNPKPETLSPTSIPNHRTRSLSFAPMQTIATLTSEIRTPCTGTFI